MTAEQLMTDPSAAHDPTLASRAYLDPMTGFRQVAAQTSVYEQPNAPAFLQNAVNSLNAEQALRRSLQSELTNRLLSGVQAGGPSSYLFDEALRAASVSPGAHVNFGAPVQSPLIGEGYNVVANAFANRLDQQKQAITAANSVAAQLTALQKQRDSLGANAFGQYAGSPQQKLDQQIFGLQEQNQPQSAVQSLGRAAASGSSGWLPSLPGY
jgi:hypothetical protein